MSFQINILSLKPVFQTIPAVSTDWKYQDYLGNIKVRLGIGRNQYSVAPGLYKTGNPDSESVVLVSANYKLSFDVLRKNLEGVDAWILVIDTKGINVWCAAGKGTFSTDNIIKGVQSASIELMVNHRKLILPQLGAPGVAAHIVKEKTGFKVIYGPVRAKDIKPFIEAGFKATQKMREITFPISERAKLIPVDFLYGKYKLLAALAIMFIVSGIDKNGILLSKMVETGPFPVTAVIAAYFAGIVFTPLLLPYIPFRAFSAKGAFSGALTAFALGLIFRGPLLEIISMAAICVAIASFLAMNFTGSSTFTSLSGVKKEMKWSVPLQIGIAITGVIVFIISKLV